jgi:hypothetical protein
MFGTVVAVVIGGLINWWFARVYYRRGARELEAEASKLRNLMRIMLVAMEEQGWAKLNRDGSGNIIGFKFERTASAQLNFRGALDIKHIPATAEAKQVESGSMTGKE